MKQGRCRGFGAELPTPAPHSRQRLALQSCVDGWGMEPSKDFQWTDPEQENREGVERKPLQCGPGFRKWRLPLQQHFVTMRLFYLSSLCELFYSPSDNAGIQMDRRMNVSKNSYFKDNLKYVKCELTRKGTGILSFSAFDSESKLL